MHTSGHSLTPLAAVAGGILAGAIGTRAADRWAFPVSTIMHWAYGSSAAAAYGIVAGSLRDPRPAATGTAFWVLAKVL